MYELHPAVQHIADKGYERMTMDEAAIVHTMRRSLAESLGHAEVIKKWLQELNPLGLKGPALSEWATKISEWVLPTQLRSQDAKQIQQASSDNGGSGTRQELREEGRDSTEGSQGIQSG